jgi:hypothetical protein
LVKEKQSWKTESQNSKSSFQNGYSISIFAHHHLDFFMDWFHIWKTYQRVQSIKENSQALLGITQSYSEPGKITEAGTAITALRGDLQGLEDDLAVLWMVSPYLGWLPAHGGDIAQAPSLLEMGSAKYCWR